MTLPDCVVHGGPDALGSVPHDFSTNANAAGPCPFVQERLQTLVADRYPDPAHAAVIERLAAMHEVSPARIIIGTSASELIMRITAAMMRLHGPQVQVRVPVHAYGDYARAAMAWGLPVSTWGKVMLPHVAEDQADSTGTAHLSGHDRGLRLPTESRVTLTWICNPDSPFGKSPPHDADTPPSAPEHLAVQVLDRVYAPLQLEGEQPDPTWLDRVWQLHSPNKALGLCGVRGGYLIAPQTLSDPDEALCTTLRALAPSWPLGAHAVALLEAWTEADTRQWLDEALMQLQEWKQMQTGGLRQRGWRVHDSLTSFFCTEPPWLVSANAAREKTDTPAAAGTAEAAIVRELSFPQDNPQTIRLQRHLRAQGIKLRETGSFGLPGAFRLCVHHPRSQEALWHALDNFHD